MDKCIKDRLPSSSEIIEAYKVDSSLHKKYDVKCGLRNADGTGILAGLTRIGDGYGVDCKNNPIHGRLIYRGIDVSDLVGKSYEEVAHLLLFGKLPSKKELANFKEMLSSKFNLPFLPGSGGNIMNRLAVATLSLYQYDESPEPGNIENVMRQCIELIARFPVMVASIYTGKDIKFVPELSLAENFLRSIRPDGAYTLAEAKALDLAMLLHAEHGGGNNSSFTVHTLASSGTDTYSVIAAAIGSLKGPKHGGASGEMVAMMNDIKTNVKDWRNEKEVSNYIERIIRKEVGDKSGLVYGMGHAVYIVSDPRAVLFKKKAAELAKEKGQLGELALYELVEKLTPGVFSEVKGYEKALCTNVDFYVGFIYQMLGIPSELCTPIFAMSRIVGWCAHRIDEIVNGSRIMRPAYRDFSQKGDQTK